MVSTAVPHPVRPTTESDDLSYLLADVQRRQQAIYSQTINKLNNGYKIDIAINIITSYYCLV